MKQKTEKQTHAIEDRIWEEAAKLSVSIPVTVICGTDADKLGRLALQRLAKLHGRPICTIDRTSEFHAERIYWP